MPTMRKTILLIAACLLLPLGAFAQNITTVSGTITDPNGLPYSYASISAQLTPTGVTPTLNGQAVSGFSRASADVNGTFSMNLASNAVLLPSGTHWQFTVNETGILPPQGTGPQQFSVSLTISGASQSISANLNAVAPALSNGGSGTTTNQTKYGVACNSSGTATAIDCSVAAPATAGLWNLVWNPTSAAAVAPTAVQVGIQPDAAAGANFTYADCLNPVYDPAAALSLLRPDVSVASGGLGNANCGTTIFNDQATASTLTPVSPWVISRNGEAAAASAKVNSFEDCNQTISQTASQQWNLNCHQTRPSHAVGTIIGDVTGSALTTSQLAYYFEAHDAVPCTITGWHISVDAGTITIKTADVATGGTVNPTLVSNSISTSGVSISSGTKVDSTTLTDFTSTTISPGDELGFFITAVSTAKQVTFSLDCRDN